MKVKKSKLVFFHPHLLFIEGLLFKWTNSLFFLQKKVNLLFFTQDLHFYLFLQKKVNLSKKKSKPVRKKVNDGEKKVNIFFQPSVTFFV